MPLMQMPTGLMLDKPPLGATPYWRWGVNIRATLGMTETLGLFGPLRNAAGTHLQLPGAAKYRSIKAIPSPTQGQIIAGSVSAVAVMAYDTGSTPGTGTRWALHDITPVGLPALVDVVSDPGVGRIEIPPTWWFVEQDDVVIAGRANDQTTAPYAWNRNTATRMTALAGAPTGAVAAGIVSRILVLLGAQSVADPDPTRFMTIRWSDRFNFEEWTPSDLNVSGELQLEGGSRIMGGGVVAKGVVAWTDTRMAILTETGDPDSVFARRYVDGGRGLMANRAWTEADGRVWWFDEARTLNVWDGGAPEQIACPLRLATLERLPDRAIARAHMFSNPEYNEIGLWVGMTNPDLPDTALVYSISDKAWSIWQLPRLAWATRIGAIRTLGVDHTNRIYQHDLDAGLADMWLPDGIPPRSGYDPLADVTPYEWTLETNLITTENPEQQAQRITRHLLDHIASPATGRNDTFKLTISGYGEARIDATTYDDDQDIIMGQTQADFRVSGKAIKITLGGTGATVWRFGASSNMTAPEGER